MDAQTYQLEYTQSIIRRKLNKQLEILKNKKKAMAKAKKTTKKVVVAKKATPKMPMKMGKKGC